MSDAVGGPRLRIELPFARRVEVDILWQGASIDEASSGAERGSARAGFQHHRVGDFDWWRVKADSKPAAGCTLAGPAWTEGPAIRPRHIALAFNDKVTEIFKTGKYQTPRSPHATLALPSQGIGAWAGHLNELPVIDDRGLRALGGTLSMPNGLTFALPAYAAEPNIVFTSQWDNYPKAVTVPLDGSARRAFLLMAGSTNFMQSRVDNGEIVVTYTDGTKSRTALRNPDNWWPIEQDYLVDDFQFPLCGSLPVRVDLKSAKVRVPDPVAYKAAAHGGIDGGAATVIDVPLDPARQLQSLTFRTIANEVVIGMMGLTLDRE